MHIIIVVDSGCSCFASDQDKVKASLSCLSSDPYPPRCGQTTSSVQKRKRKPSISLKSFRKGLERFKVKAIKRLGLPQDIVDEVLCRLIKSSASGLRHASHYDHTECTAITKQRTVSSITTTLVLRECFRSQHKSLPCPIA